MLKSAAVIPADEDEFVVDEVALDKNVMLDTAVSDVPDDIPEESPFMELDDTPFIELEDTELLDRFCKIWRIILVSRARESAPEPALLGTRESTPLATIDLPENTL